MRNSFSIQREITGISISAQCIPRSVFLLFVLICTVCFTTSSFASAAFPFHIQEGGIGLDSPSAKADTLYHIKLSSDSLEYPVAYNADDSIITDVIQRKIFLYNNAHVIYNDIDLQAYYIELDWKENTISAFGLKDSSSGKTVGLPHFKQGDDEYEAEKIVFNFKTKRGKVTDVITQQDDGFIHSEVVKRNADNSFYAKGNKYTTCNYKEHPDFFIQANKMKVVPDKVIVSGPAHLVIEDVPTPLFVPFAIFPLHKSRASGILLPEFGQRADLGYALQNGGYYFAINDFIDLTLRGDIYSRGSWRLTASSTYSKRYRYNGDITISYSRTRQYQIESNSVDHSNDFKINWTFSQDSKANPKHRFNSSVNAGTSRYDKTYSYDAENFLNNTLKSSITYYKVINDKMNFTLNLSHDQNTQSHLVSLALPNLNFNVQRITPFKRKISSGEKKWYEKLGFSYTLNAMNKVQQADSLIFEPATLDRFTNGLKQSIPISTSFNLFKYINVSPSANFNQYMYLQSIRKFWNNASDKLETDTVKGFVTGYDFYTSINLSTHLYGIKNFKHGKLKAIRHIVSPNAGFRYQPDFGASRYGIYHEVQYDTLGNMRLYSILEQSPFGGPQNGLFGGIDFGISNQLEMKVFSKKDTINQTRKVKLLDNLSINSSYNLALDTFQLGYFSINARTTLFDKISIQFNSLFDPYALNEQGRRINSFEWHVNQRLARLTSASISTGTNFHSKTKNKASYVPSAYNEDEWEMIGNHPEQYVDFNVPWNFSVNYILRLNKLNLLGTDTTTYTQTLNFNFDFNLSKQWKIEGSSGYDFKQKDFSYTTIQILRDLHCWQMSIRWIPFGTRQGYFFNLNVKSEILQDLKLVKRSPGWGNY